MCKSDVGNVSDDDKLVVVWEDTVCHSSSAHLCYDSCAAWEYRCVINYLPDANCTGRPIMSLTSI